MYLVGPTVCVTVNDYGGLRLTHFLGGSVVVGGSGGDGVTALMVVLGWRW